ncbi:Pimeloyl-ACP methyl ester carboxylesterase [Micromonospora pattaloongensis]|uniref:Pimeloyl-ACP methyl ester carboxylesterase n=1 Tax=Micromonospora pattaloongensis TaxID=405436 RepID=A0A1H3P9Q0_9ACTN|nr:alpha/beta hydrolase [Micromonospora pattaloongensis]SDY97884.1 Pimeloyl-ACP methyl ester carboxylesterase [Micromonospora pattaloongensis]
MGGERVPSGFTEQTARVGDVTLHYVHGGRGRTVVLLHGYPQTWYMWRKVLPELAAHYTIIAPDLRGSGGSDAPAEGYDKKTLAGDVHGLLTQLGLDRDVSLVGHDIGAMVAYAYAAAHAGDVRHLVLTEAPIPDQSLYQAPSLTPNGPGWWNLGFFSVPNGLPEFIVEGREALWVDRFTDSMLVQKTGIRAADVAEYARHLRDSAHLRASFAYFRAMPRDVADNAEYGATKLPMPVLALGGRASLGDRVAGQAAQYATTVTGGVIEECGHWLFEEQPAQLTEQLRQFLPAG